jgi:hypothetical protein
MPASAIHIDDLCWPTTRYSDVMKIDRRVVAQALETVHSMERNGARVWHIRDGMPAIFRRLHGLDAADGTADPKKLPPKDRLDHYRAERERIKLEQEMGTLLTALEISNLFTRGMKEQKDALSNIRTAVEHHCDVSIEVLTLIEQIVDRALEENVENWRKLVDGNERSA